MTQPEGRYLAPVQVQADAGGQPVTVHVHLADVGGRVVCVGLDVRTTGWQPLTSSTVRGLRTAAIIEDALRQGRQILDVLLEGMPDQHTVSPEVVSAAFAAASVIEVSGPSSLETFRPELAAEVSELFTPAPEDRPRRGPKPALDDDALRRVVAPAYRTGGSKPVRAVLAALEASGHLHPPITIDQARKAVMSARARGFIPPAASSRRTYRKDQS